MLSARQLLLMRRACDRAIGIAIAPTGAVALPDPDFRRRLSLDRLAEWIKWQAWAVQSSLWVDGALAIAEQVEV
jgi:hypothetical protein